MAINIHHSNLCIVDKKCLFYDQAIQGHCSSIEITKVDIQRVRKTLIGER